MTERRFTAMPGLIGALLSLIGAACHDGPAEPPVASVAVTSPVDTLLVRGRTVQMSAAATDAAGALVSGVDFRWSSSNSRVATISASGLLSALEPGGATITATAQNRRTGTVSGSLRVAILPADLAAVTSLLNDPFVRELVAHLSSDRVPALHSVLDGCAAGSNAGNVPVILECIDAARGEAASATDPTDRVLLAVLTLHLDGIERLLGL